MSYLRIGDQLVHLNQPGPSHYIARVRRPGCRLYEVLQKPNKRPHRFHTEQGALTAMVREFAKGHYKRGDVLMVENDPMSYYGPHFVAEITK